MIQAQWGATRSLDQKQRHPLPLTQQSHHWSFILRAQNVQNDKGQGSLLQPCQE